MITIKDTIILNYQYKFSIKKKIMTWWNCLICECFLCGENSFADILSGLFSVLGYSYIYIFFFQMFISSWRSFAACQIPLSPPYSLSVYCLNKGVYAGKNL